MLGEWQVNVLIKFCLDKRKYHLIKNVTLPTFIEGKAQGTTQIDHIIVSKYGIFVVETKNIKGWIFGSANQKQWTQQIFKHKSKFQNPLHQNYKHIKTLETCLRTKSERLFSVIIFIGDSKFKTSMPENVRFAHGGIAYIKSKTEIVLSDEEVTRVIEEIESGRLARGFKINREHVKHVQGIVKEKSQAQVVSKPDIQVSAKVDTKVCPKCGAEMMLRKARKGKNAGKEFWGCSGFPKCRNVIEVS